MEDNPQTANDSEDQPPETTDNDLKSEEPPLELPENMDLDGNDEKEQANEENLDDINLPEDENIELPNEENADDEEQMEEQNDRIDSTKKSNT